MEQQFSVKFLAALAVRQADRIEALEKSGAEMYRRLNDGTLHVLHCNADHDSRVGTTGTGCSCNLGREIMALRLRTNTAEQALAAALKRLEQIEAVIRAPRMHWMERLEKISNQFGLSFFPPSKPSRFMKWLRATIATANPK